MTSVATAETTPSGVHEVVRRWTPAREPRAEIVLCHGLAEHSGRYERAGEVLAAAGFAVTAYDQIGFGGSGGARAWVDSWSDVLDQVQRHIEEAKATGRPTVLLGHSNGGLFALEYALAERPAPDLLVLSAPALDGGAAWQRIGAEVLDRVGPKVMVPNNLKGSQLSRDPAVGEDYFSDPLNQHSTTGRYAAELFRAMKRVGAVVDRLAIPTFVIHGAADTIVRPESTAVLGEVPAVERRLYPAIRHELFNEPEGPEIVGDVVEWIDRQLG